jgi:hypothetical protein
MRHRSAQHGVAAESEAEMRAAVERHWTSSDASDEEDEYAIYAEGVELEYPQSGERFVGLTNVRASRGNHPAQRRFRLVRLVGSGQLWVSEVIISYDGDPFQVVSVMQFADGAVAHETQYFTKSFEAPAWRAGWRQPDALAPPPSV